MKEFSRAQYFRTRRILELIRAGTRGGRYPSCVDLGRELGVSRWTVLRALDLLRDDENAPIEYVASRHGYRLTDETWSLPPVQLSRREVFAFSVAGKLLRSFRGTPLELDIGSVLRKIGESLEGSVTLELGALTEHLTVLGEDYVPQDAGTWAAVAGCVDRRERMRVRYERFDGQVGAYELEPYHLVFYHGNWYVLAWNAAKERTATFAVSRIRRLQPTGALFEVPSGFDVQAHIRAAFGITGGEKPFGVRLLFAPKVAAYIRERVWHPDQKFLNKRDGGVELRFRTTGWKELVRWVLSWQPDVRVLAPKRLRERVAEKMREGLGRSRKSEVGSRK